MYPNGLLTKRFDKVFIKLTGYYWPAASLASDRQPGNLPVPGLIPGKDNIARILRGLLRRFPACCPPGIGQAGTPRHMMVLSGTIKLILLLFRIY